MKLSKAEKATLKVGQAFMGSGALIAFAASLLPLNNGEYMNALVGGLELFALITVAGFVPFVVAAIISTVVARFK